MPPIPSGSSRGCACWSGSSPTRASIFPTRSSACAPRPSIEKDRDMGLFDPRTIWVLIPLAAIFAGMWRRWLRVKEKQLDAQTRDTAERTAQYAAHTERLERRVRVLERIVTDKGIDLSDEIERLRDDRVN